MFLFNLVNSFCQASQVVAQCFYDVFPGIIDDILPTGDGPYMFFGYLDQW